MKITIVIRTHSRPEFLKEALSSIHLQSHTDWELLLFDDSGNEDNYSIYHKFKSEHKDNRCIYMTAMKSYYLFKNSWMYGFQLAEGDVLIRLDDDDLLMPNTLEYINSIYELNKDLDFSYGSSKFFKGNEVDNHSIIARSPNEMKNVHAWVPYLIPNNAPWVNPYCWWTDHFKDNPQPFTSIVHASRSNQLCIYHLYAFRVSSVMKVLDKIEISSTMVDDLEVMATLDYLSLGHSAIKTFLTLVRIHEMPRVTDLDNKSSGDLGWCDEIERVRNKLDEKRPGGFTSRVVSIHTPELKYDPTDIQSIGNQWIMEVKNNSKSY
jgi:glycosyltransferase involved in cell wall biosynthesis